MIGPPVLLAQAQGAAGQSLAALREGLDTPMAARLMGLVGVAAMLAIAWALSYDRKRTPWRMVTMGLGLQLVLGVLVLKTPVGRAIFDAVNLVFTRLLGFTREGAAFVFGNLVQRNVPVGVPKGDPVYGDLASRAAEWAQVGAGFAFAVLPTIIFFASLMTVLYYLGLMQWVVKGVAWVMQKTLGTSGAETLSAAGNIFMGQTEAPLLVKPFVGRMTQSELMTIMIGGFATVAGGVMAAYVQFLQPYFPDIAGHLLTASVMNAPAGLVVAKILLPEAGEPETRGTLRIGIEKTEANVIEAAASGAATGVQLVINVASMLIAFIALIALLNFGVGKVGALVGNPELSIQTMLGFVLRPLAFLMGVPWHDAGTVGALVGVKVTLNEFVAYTQFAGLLGGGEPLSPRAAVIGAYALLGFANFSSIAIQIGGIGGLAPHRRGDLSRLGLRAMIGGNLAAFMSASIAGMLV